MSYTTQNTFEVAVDTYGVNGGTGGGGGGGGWTLGDTASVSGPTPFVSLACPPTAKFILVTARGVTGTASNYGIFIQDGLTGISADVAAPLAPAALILQAFSIDSITYTGMFSVGETNGDPAVTDMMAGSLLQPIVDVQIGGVSGDLTAGTFALWYQ